MLDWNDIDTVLLDMDGTLLDLHFDDFFWQEYLPKKWGERNALDTANAKQELLPHFEEKAGTLSWYCVEYWSERLDIDVMTLKEDITHLIQKRPHSEEFLVYLNKMEKHVVMVTNAHQRLVEMKFRQTGIDSHFQHVFSAHAIGAPKEDLEFWHRLGRQVEYIPGRTLLIDDNLTVLRTARDHGIAHLFGIVRPNSQAPEKDTAEFNGLASFEHLMV